MPADDDVPDFVVELGFAREPAGFEAPLVEALREPFADAEEPEVVVDDDLVDAVVVDEVCDPVTCETSFFAPSRTVSPRSPARLIAKSLTVWTPSCTFGWLQTSSAALRICS